MKRNLLALMALVLAVSLIFVGCDKDQGGEGTSAPTQSENNETVAPTESVAPKYEKQTTYLCVRTTREMWDGSGTSVEEYEYDEFGNMITETNVTYGDVTTHKYDEYGNRISTRYVSPDGSYGTYTEMTYDQAGNLLTEVTTGLDRTPRSENTYVYDDAGFVVDKVCKQHYNNTVYHYVITYNADHTTGTVKTYKNDEYAGMTVETYNEKGDLLRSSNYDAEDGWKSAVSCEYDSAGRLAVEWKYSSSELQADYDVIYTYDENGLLTNVNVDYYYGYGTDYEYETLEIKVRVD